MAASFMLYVLRMWVHSESVFQVACTSAIVAKKSLYVYSNTSICALSQPVVPSQIHGEFECLIAAFAHRSVFSFLTSFLIIQWRYGGAWRTPSCIARASATKEAFIVAKSKSIAMLLLH
ncbi:hypothetical protein EDB19DRAFT_1741514 [Suillus lakei]|nr:hypothetical protein EDB19DRAFT_1741514 [Suillus lakei]